MHLSPYVYHIKKKKWGPFTFLIPFSSLSNLLFSLTIIGRKGENKWEGNKSKSLKNSETKKIESNNILKVESYQYKQDMGKWTAAFSFPWRKIKKKKTLVSDNEKKQSLNVKLPAPLAAADLMRVRPTNKALFP